MKVILVNDEAEVIDAFWLYSHIEHDPVRLAYAIRAQIEGRFDTFDSEEEYDGRNGTDDSE